MRGISNDLIQKEGPDTVARPTLPNRSWEPAASSSAQKLFCQDQCVLANTTVRIIADEVICGSGATGEWFGSTAWA